MKKEVFIHTPFIKMDALIKLAGVTSTGGHAKVLILEGNVLHNGEVCTMRGKKCVVGDVITVEGMNIHVTQGNK